MGETSQALADLSLAMTAAGMDCTDCVGSEAGLEALNTKAFDIVLIDTALPESGGLRSALSATGPSLVLGIVPPSGRKGKWVTGQHIVVLIALPWDLEELAAIACAAAKRISIRAA
jgi:DNA-binding NtrC family response regulator